MPFFSIDGIGCGKKGNRFVGERRLLFGEKGDRSLGKKRSTLKNARLPKANAEQDKLIPN
ncbi:hypothetical protein [Laspinema olomoucense]|uniref:hypothetical protein n=1 Tax=Laspinema olomoucense TaxID=3231600 RepID=UPI0021BA71B6|nr:hypothetical protein [Laspinema sp. D3c]MCT7996120.1 hypothetical protein [Laspinema sp. D3c]